MLDVVKDRFKALVGKLAVVAYNYGSPFISPVNYAIV